ncbi:MAG: type VI secretion system ATPase TssH [Desulfovibrio sp.]|nr:type VI secretion system ATPase TssH [Desulfovibrio sp.]
MVGVDIKSLLGRCGKACTEILYAAAGQAVNRQHYEVAVEHFLLAALESPETDIPVALARAGIDEARVRKALGAAMEHFRSGSAGRPVFSPLLLDLLEAAWIVSSLDLGLGAIRTGAVLMAFLDKPAVYAQGAYLDAFGSLSRQDLLKGFRQLVEASREDAPALGQDQDSADAGSPAAEARSESFCAKYCQDFTAQARSGKVDPVFGRDPEIRQIVDILARRRKNNPILVGEPGVGKTAVIEGLALRIAQGDVPDTLQGVSLLGLDLGLLEAGAGMKGEFERRLKGVLDEIKASPKPIVLFIDEAHMLVGAGGSAGGSDAANLMKPALARGEIRTCAATTWKEYKKYFEKDPALARRFQPVKLDEPSVENAKLILQGVKSAYEKAHGVFVRHDAVCAAAELSDRYITGRFLPDKAIDLLDTACARVKVSQSAKPASLEDKERAAQALGREIRSMADDLANDLASEDSREGEAMQALRAQKAALEAECDALRAEWQAQREAALAFVKARNRMLAFDAAPPLQAPAPASQEEPAGGAAEAGEAKGGEEADGRPETREEATAAFTQAKASFEALCAGGRRLVLTEVTADSVARVVSDWTGVPVGKLAREQAGTVADLAGLLGARIKGQDQALAALAKGIQASFAGLRSPNQPLGVFLLAGPSGVGKTETGLALADALFGDEKSVVSVNMSEFQEKHTVSRLIGSPPGYVGYGEGGMLTEAVRRRPYSVVLLDEVEKAHIDVMNLFYQVFDKGVLTDGEGKEVSFRNTVIMLTSNLASDILMEMGGAELEACVEAIRPVLAEHFRPALLARMNIVPYLPLDPSAMGRIAALKLDALARRLNANNGMVLRWRPEVVAQIEARCQDGETGARKIDYILSGSVLPELSQKILRHMGDGGLPENVVLGVGEDGAFTMDFNVPSTDLPEPPAGPDEPGGPGGKDGSAASGDAPKAAEADAGIPEAEKE